MNKKKSVFSTKLPRGNGTHASLVCLVGAYVIYMAYGMIQNTRTGKSQMSMELTLVLAILMTLIGLGVIGYGVMIWYAIWKQSDVPENPASAPQDESETADSPAPDDVSPTASPELEDYNQ